MAGLYTKNNLSESGLNATDALQKLYGPQVQQDMLLFAFSNRLESGISSPTTSTDNQIYGFVNEPIADFEGNVSLRTKFITQARVNNTSEAGYLPIYTFSDNNRVWFDKFSDSFDQRTADELDEGADVKYSVNGGMVFASLAEAGANYSVKTSTGESVTLPATVDVRVYGSESGASNATVSVTVDANGKISSLSPFEVKVPGSGYVYDEFLELIPACKDYEDPNEDKCIRYSGSALHFEPFVNNEVSPKAVLKNEKYTYRVRFSDRDGFFLYDDRVGKYVYLGQNYDSSQAIQASPGSASIVIKRSDTITSDNLVQLYNLDGRSSFFEYGDAYETSGSISNTILSLSTETEELRNEFKYFLQNSRTQKTEFDSENNLGTRFNIIEGKNFVTDYRLVMRDPDSVLDQSTPTFTTLSGLSEADQIKVDGMTVPGIWLWTGEKYQRIYSSDDKPFSSADGKRYLSPAIFAIGGGTTELASSGAYKYSLSASYYKPGQALTTNSIKGFDTTISTLVQNLSSTAGGGGFVFHRTLSTTNVTTNGGFTVKSWPLFSYVEDNQVKDARFLAI